MTQEKPVVSQLPPRTSKAETLNLFISHTNVFSTQPCCSNTFEERCLSPSSVTVPGTSLKMDPLLKFQFLSLF